MIFYTKQVLLALLLVVFSFFCGFSQTPIQIKTEKDFYSLSKSITFYEDKSSLLDIETVSGKEFENRFKPHLKENINFSYSGSTFWFRFRIQNVNFHKKEDYNSNQNWLLEVGYPLLDEVSFYHLDSNNKIIRKIQTGEMRPFRDRAVAHRLFIFPLQLNQPDVQTYYLQIKTQSPVYVPLTIRSYNNFYLLSLQYEFYYGIFVGVCLLVLSINLYSFYMTRDMSYLVYVFFIIFSFLSNFTMSGNISRLGFVNIGNWQNTFFLLVYNTQNALAAIYAILFLHIRLHSTYLYKAIYLLALISIPLYLLVLFSPYHLVSKALQLMSFILLLFLLTSGIVAYQKGYKTARFYIMAYSFYTILIIPMTLNNYGFLQNTIMLYARLGPELAMMTEIVFLSIALIDRTRHERKQAIFEKENAMKEVIRLQEISNKDLAEKIEERTHELAITNEKLGKKYKLLSVKNQELSESNQLIDLLFSELNHRVLNNLQVVSLLLRTEKRIAEKKGNPINLEKIESRIGELANVHRLLMYGKNRQTIVDLAEYLGNIIEVLTKLYQEESQIVKIHIDTQNIQLPLSHAYFLGFIVYELLSNSLKYAYEGVNEPEFRIQLAQKDKAFELQVGDNGKGLPAEVYEGEHLSKSGLQTLGLKIVAMIAQIYQGDFRIEKKSQQMGVCFKIRLTFV